MARNWVFTAKRILELPIGLLAKFQPSIKICGNSNQALLAPSLPEIRDFGWGKPVSVARSTILLSPSAEIDYHIAKSSFGGNLQAGKR
ncbi:MULTISPECIES: hypothetical protein [unclassified Microcoleus]|uniref:hypothetical protein n=1 Tax=unclassified Microcoleus TaxID=2642155 RepID=UPI0025D064E7|nr:MULTISPECIES: hypothetical protein [unclassified Microcoleus]